MSLPRWLSRLRLTLNFDLGSVVDVLFPDQVEADDRFVPSRLRDLEERRRLSALTESSPRRLVVTK